MKKYIYSLIIALIIIFPISINALSLQCDEGEYSYGDSFKCNLIGEANITYKELSADIEENDYLSCTISKYGAGLLENMNGIKTSGTPAGSGEVPYIEFNCKVKTKTTAEEVSTQFILKNVKYTNTEDVSSDAEIIRSNSIKVTKYVDRSVITTTDTKPRSTSNGNSLLKKLDDENLKDYFTFSKFITQYKFDVLYEVDEVNLKYETNVEGADVRIEGSNKLEIGENTIDIYVTSPDLTSQTCYTLVIRRLPRGEAIYYPEKDATLKKLTLKNYPINFESVIKQYTIKVDSTVDQIDITPVVNVDGASFVIEGNNELKNKSTITITVTSKDNSTKETYSILVLKEKEEVDYSSYIYLGVIGFALLLLIIFIVRSSNKRNSEVEKDMEKFTKLFGKKKKKEENPNIPQVTSGGTTAVPVQPVTPIQPVAPVTPVPQVQVQPVVQPVQPVNPVPQQQVVQPVQTVQPVVPQQPVPQVQPVAPVAQQPVQPIEQQNPNNQI